ncbi:hypothetical protein HMPREF0518_1034 [Lactobacillus helveticus DSM 20075 = CGMCC 1.1877]|nr:hypothetical protein HMPREF0518_1034 [Lactobacillus helveticus DSM 20075 = CGMCC 1.1877]
MHIFLTLILFDILASSFLFVFSCIIIFKIIKNLTVLRHQLFKPSSKFHRVLLVI